MSLIRAMEVVEDSHLPATIAEDVQSALAFTQAVHDLFHDYGVLSTDDVDVNQLEKAIEAIIGENAAAAIFLASLPNTEKQLRATGKASAKEAAVPAIVAEGYTKLADRVENTRAALQED